MQTKTILFDLDGTLLPMDQDVFTKAYFTLLAKKLAPHGYAPEKLINAVWKGTAAMVKNDGKRTNEEAFWAVFSDIFGAAALSDRPLIEDFYRVEFQQAASACGFETAAAETVALAKELGYRVVLATNPIFPRIATESRIRWAGLVPAAFEYITTYENCGYCKPNVLYYREILDRIGAEPTACLMVGNDVSEDMAARALGMEVFLLTDCLINKENRDISEYPNGGFPALRAFLRARTA